jgi:oligopeptide transport system substrate-binding protein
MKQGIVSKRRSVHLWVVRYLVLAVLTLCSGCSPQPRADLVFLNGAEPETLDPALITGQPEGRVANALFEGLLTFNEHGKPQPGMAETQEISEDGRVYTFTMRDGLTWSDGTPLTARDFVASWRRTLDPATGSEYAYQLHYIKNAKAFNEGEI